MVGKKTKKSEGWPNEWWDEKDKKEMG